MIDWKSQTIGTSPKELEPIVGYTVKFMTPGGLFDNVSEAVDWCESFNLQAAFGIKACVVAYNDKYSEVL